MCGKPRVGCLVHRKYHAAKLCNVADSRGDISGGRAARSVVRLGKKVSRLDPGRVDVRRQQCGNVELHKTGKSRILCITTAVNGVNRGRRLLLCRNQELDVSVKACAKDVSIRSVGKRKGCNVPISSRIA